jgi:hypothetical protein
MFILTNVFTYLHDTRSSSCCWNMHSSHLVKWNAWTKAGIGAQLGGNAWTNLRQGLQIRSSPLVICLQPRRQVFLGPGCMDGAGCTETHMTFSAINSIQGDSTSRTAAVSMSVDNPERMFLVLVPQACCMRARGTRPGKVDGMRCNMQRFCIWTKGSLKSGFIPSTWHPLTRREIHVHLHTLLHYVICSFHVF